MTDTTAAIRPFSVEIAQADLDDLLDRLARTRLPAAAPGDDWDYGTPNHYLREMVDHWRDGSTGGRRRARMNAVPALPDRDRRPDLHFIHVPSAEPDATPLLLAHTYPGSFVDFLDMIGPLTDPVAHGGGARTRSRSSSRPSPASASALRWSTAAGRWPASPARSTPSCAGSATTSYGAHGSDGGAMVARELGLLNPPGFLGLHVLQLFSFPSGDPAEFEKLTPKDYAALEHLQWFQSVGGYNAINATRPQTVAVGISDSPVGQLAWNELFNNFGNGTSLVTRDQILTEVSLYWFTNTSADGRRATTTRRPASGAEPVVNHAPTGVAVFADDFKTIRPFAERDNTNIVHWCNFERRPLRLAGAPGRLAADLRTFFASLR